MMARLKLEKAMGDKIKTTFVENVPETANSERVFRQLAADGNKLIFALLVRLHGAFAESRQSCFRTSNSSM